MGTCYFITRRCRHRRSSLWRYRSTGGGARLEVLTDWITKSQDAVLDEDGNVVKEAVAEIARKGVLSDIDDVDGTVLQEAQTRIETLETKVAALEEA